MTRNPTIAAFTCCVAVASADIASAQTVVLSEIVADAADAWIEVHNRTGLPVDLSQWSLFLATATPGRPQTYWWAFPPGTTLAGNDFLRVHWLSPVPQQALPGELHTGDTPFHFLFGLGAEPLPATRGAIALLRTQQNGAMNMATSFADYVCWGQGGLSRELLAVQAGLWQSGTATAPIAPESSLARNVAAIGTHALRADEWFLDATPTPLEPNAGSAAVRTVGTPCVAFGARLLGPPALTATSTPVAGNGAFALQLANTTGVLFETCMFAFAAGEAPPGQPALLPVPVTGPACGEYLDASRVLGCTFRATGVGRTVLPFPLTHLPASLAGARVTVQALVLDALPYAYPPFQGTSNGLTITLGN